MNHKIAILSDIHGNTTALAGVLEDAKNLGATEYWLLGDIFLPGPGANDLVALLKDLPITASVRGNWDDCVLEALDGQYGLEDTPRNPAYAIDPVSDGASKPRAY